MPPARVRATWTFQLIELLKCQQYSTYTIFYIGTYFT